MIATIAGTAVASLTVIITRVQRNTSSKTFMLKAKGGSLAASPFRFFLLCRLGSALEARMFRERRAPQERCDQL
jgi:hypothetical protein